jgi:hypothetical protein
MIIILNGMLGTDISGIAKQLSLVLNNKETNEIPDIYEDISFNESFQVNYKDDDTNQFHTIGKEVKDNTEDEKKIKKYYNFIDKYSQIENLDISLINNIEYNIEYNLFENSLPDPFIDTEKFKPLDVIIERSSTNIKRKIYSHPDIKYHIICGQISKYAIDKFKEIFINEDLKIFNIIMNPLLSESVYKSKGFTDKTSKINKLLLSDVQTAIKLKNDSSIETIKFENIIETSGIPFNKKFLKLINVKNRYYNTPLDFKLNNIYSSVNFYKIWEKWDDENESISFENSNLFDIETDCFKELGYEKINKGY